MKTILFIITYLIYSCSNLLAENPKLQSSQFEFQQKLYNKFIKTEGDIVFSPFSIYSALSMAYLGSEDITKSEFENNILINKNLLNDIKSKQELLSKKQDLLIANAFFAQTNYSFKQDYIDKLEEIFNTKPIKLDFYNHPLASEKEINLWVEKRTNSLIKNLIPRNTLTNLTRSVLVNAIYFNGKWLNKFDSKNTVKSNFSKLNGKNISMDFLNATFSNKYFEDNNIQAVELPYKDSQLSMLIILPKLKNRDAFKQMENKMDQAYFSNIIENLEEAKTEIKLPKFKSEFQILLSDVLKEIGLKAAFSQKEANFSNMSIERGLHISEVIHKAYIEVQEEGTKAAAATSVIMVGRSLKKTSTETKKFYADHPFLYFIRDRQTKLNFFMGRLT